MKVFDGRVAAKANEANSVFIINDIALEIPPTHISIRKEDMVWQWKTLRTKSSTKNPSGRGIAQISARLVFTPVQFLSMHRLIIQFIHSPFCWIENALLRDSLVPDWSNTQNMAFTLTGLNLQNMTGSPGTFILDLDLRWFNYSPYALNWLYRDEYATVPVGPEGVVRSIATYGPMLKKEQTVIDFLPGGPDALQSYEILSQTKDIVGGFTMDDLIFNHAGTAFDLLPRPTDAMRKARPVNALMSNIYKRYINSLQQKALFNNFGVDIAQMIKERELPGQLQELRNANIQFDEEEIAESFVASTWKMFTSGHILNAKDGGHFNRVESLHSDMLPNDIRMTVIKECLKFCKGAEFIWHQYLVDDVDPKIRKAMSALEQKAHKDTRDKQFAQAQLLKNIISATAPFQGNAGQGMAVNLKSISEVSLITSRNVPSSSRINHSESQRRPDLLSMLPEKTVSDEIDSGTVNEPPYLFSPVLDKIDSFSGFGMRRLESEDEERAHNGIDLVSFSTKNVYAPFNGTLTIRSQSPYNHNSPINRITGNDDSDDKVGQYTRRQHLERNNLISSGNPGIKIRIVSTDYPGYSVDFHHLDSIGKDGVINETQVANLFTDESDTERYGGIEVVQKTISVKRGQLIGLWGDTGPSFGPHLHFELKYNGVKYDPFPFLIARDVSSFEDDQIQDLDLTEDGLPATNHNNGVPYNYQQAPGAAQQSPPEDEEESEDIDLAQEVIDEYKAQEERYIENGFIPYEDMQDVTNVRKRTVKLSFISENNDLMPGIVPDFLDDSLYKPNADSPEDNTHVLSIKSSDNMVITNVVGSLTHVVASIPLLGHEFPTHQHLGSMEPSYNIEFVTQADTLFNDNLSAEGALFEYMRATLQRNSREFRPIPDGYAVATDHFITRLFGSYNEDDFNSYSTSGVSTEIEELKKRTLINRVSIQTVEGHPGLSSIQVSLVETNPYITEELSIESNSEESGREELIQEVLHRLYNLNLTPEGRTQGIVDKYATNVFTEESDIVEKLEAAGLSPSDFGKFGWEDVKEVAVFTANNQETFSGTNIVATPYTIEEQPAFNILSIFEASKETAIYGDYHEPPANMAAVSSSTPNREDGSVTNFYYDLTEFYTVYPELKPSNDGVSSADGNDIERKYRFLMEILRSASFSVAESEFGVSESVISESFYNLPFKGQMIGCFKYWFEKYLLSLTEKVTRFTSDSADLDQAINIDEDAIEKLIAAISWQLGEGEISDENKALIDKNYSVLEGKVNIILTGVEEIIDTIDPNIDFDSGLFKEQAELLEDFKSSVQELSSAYIDTFVKLDIHKEDVGFFSEIFGSLTNWIASIGSQVGVSPSEVSGAYSVTQEQIGTLCNWIFSPDSLRGVNLSILVGLYKFAKTTASVYFFIELILLILTVPAMIIAFFEPTPIVEGVVLTGSAVSRKLAKDLLFFISKKWLHFIRLPATKAAALGASNAIGVLDVYANQALNEEEYSETVENTLAFQVFSTVSAAIPPYEGLISSDTESQKLVFFRKQLRILANSIISNPSLLVALGIRIENYSFAPMLNEWVGKECYPDLDLPEHPYYIGTHSYAMSPDFYMWSAYEDGSLSIKGEIKSIVEEGVNKVVSNSYKFMKQMQGEGIRAVKDGGMQINNTGTDTTAKILSVVNHPEGTDAVDLLNADAIVASRSSNRESLEITMADGSSPWDTYDISANAFRMNGELEDEAWKKLSENAGSNLETNAYYSTNGQNYLPGGRTGNAQAYRAVVSGGVPIIALGNYTLNPQYMDADFNEDTYSQYFEKVQNITEMFGSKQGYLGEEITEENAAEMIRAIGDSALASIQESGNFYTEEGLKTLVKQSSADIVSEKITMKRAYPTFKLYFIEEDEQESRWLNLDDFYSFNAVKEFNFYQSRKHASSTATIVLQNIAGTLDGTRRSAVVDLDYFSKKSAGEIKQKKGVEVLADNKQHIASKDQPIDALVLRPGLNVQLRVGYSNDPNMLHVLLNGRVVDVQWNVTGDLSEISVQSFGTELTQTKKGISGNDYSVDWDSRVHYTTHDLLGSLMLDRDLKHFGRWEFGRLVQIGEDKNADLDFYPYEDEGLLGGSPTAEFVFNFMRNHAVVMGLAIGVLGATVLSRGRLGRISRIFGARNYTKHPVLGRIPLIGRTFSTPLAAEGASTFKAIGAISKLDKSEDIFKILGTQVGAKLDASIKALSLSASELSSVNQLKAMLNGLSGGARAKQVSRLENAAKRINRPITGASGSVEARRNLTATLAREVEALAKWQNASRWLYWPRFGMGQFKSWSGISSNAWGLTKLILGNTLIKPYTNIYAAGIPILAAAAISDSTYSFTLKEFISEYIDSIKKRSARINARLKLSPADDNIYPPSPSSYMSLRKLKDKPKVEKLKGVVNGWAETITGINVKEKWKDLKLKLYPEDIDPAIFDKRVLPAACQYTLHASTIWEVFEEMTKRHPGWIWGTRPYGTELRETMFFGTPSQRYWSKPASPAFVIRMNKLYNYIVRPGETEEIVKSQITEVYGSDIADKMLEESEDILGNQLQQIGAGVSGSPSTPLLGLGILKDKFRIAVMDEWLKGMEQRFEPFRRYHFVTSERDIISNNIICSEHSVTNAVQVSYTEISDNGHIDPKNKKVLQMKAHSLTPDHMLNTAVVEDNNCISYKMGLRYGQAALMYGLKEMYKGEISMLGNPRIRPWDVCIIADSYNDISGPVEVESVVHMFSHETGFITEIKPNALVAGNEIATFPMVEALKLYAMAKKDLERQGAPRPDLEQGPRGVGNIEAQEYFNKRYSEIFDGEATGYIDEINKIIDESPLMDSLDVDVGSNLDARPTGSRNYRAQWTVGTGVFGAAAVAMGAIIASRGGLKLGSSLLNKGAGFVNASEWLVTGSGGVAAGMAVAPGVDALVDSAAGLIGTRLLFAKCMEQETVTIIPLLKGRRPIVSGMSIKNPSDIFESILGSVTNVVEDSIVGTKNMFDSWQEYKTASWMQVDEIVDERNEFFRTMYTNRQIFYNWKKDYRVGQ